MATTLSSESAELRPGTTLLGRYTIIDHIAGGGMATIYRATDERLERVVCVKLLRLVVEGSGSTSGGAVYQATYSHFLQEALSLSRLSHPNTLRIYDFGYVEAVAPRRGRPTVPEVGRGRPFQISEFLDGGNLEQFVRARGALNGEQTSAILERMAGAAAEAHQHGIIHRDIKPSNILFARVGPVLMPKLADFGIAKVDLRKRRGPNDADDTLEVVSTIPLFSPRWAAPEQIAETEEGPATDVYGLGLVVAYMLGGEPLFDQGDVRSTFRERVRGDDLVAHRLEELRIAPPARAVLLEAMRADPKKRTASPVVFQEALSRALGGARAPLPPRVTPPRPSFESITIEMPAAADRSGARAAEPVVPPEQWTMVGDVRARVVEVHERLDLALPTAFGITRFRVTLIPSRGASFRLHLKGLNCFVAKAGSPPSPAIVTDADGRAELVSMTRERIAHVAWTFGVAPATQSVTLELTRSIAPDAPERAFGTSAEAEEASEIVVICRRG